MNLLLRKFATGALLSLGAGLVQAQSPAIYCINNLGGSGCDISSVSITGTALSSPGYCQASRTNGSQYSVYPAENGTTATLAPGATYQLVVRFSVRRSASLWLDANGNGTFEPAEWTLITAASPATTATSVTVSFVVPATARPGQTRLRLRSRELLSPNGATDACTDFGAGGGDTRDYTVTIGPVGTASSAPYCAPSYQNIAGDLQEVVLAGTTLHGISGTPVGGAYYQYPASGATTAQVERGRSYPLYAYIIGSFYPPVVGAWVDWNHNQQFEASEYQPVDVGGLAPGYYYTAPLTVPANALLGSTRLRLRSRENGSPIAGGDACASFAWGEAEDYTLTVVPNTTPPLPTYNPAPLWSAATNYGTGNNDAIEALAVDSASGATYGAGRFSNSTRFGTFTATAGSGSNGAFLTKFDASGTPLWVRATDLASASSSARVSALALDRQGNVYVTGSLTGTARFGPGVSVTTSSYGGAFLAKYSPAGTALWATTVLIASSSSGGETVINGLAVDAQGNACVVGAIYLSNTRATDVYVSKFDAQGTQVWLRNFGSPLYDRAHDVAALPGGDFALVVAHRLPFTLDNTFIAGSGSAVLRLTAAGALVWARPVTATVLKIRYDAGSGDLFVAGQGYDGAVFDQPGSASSELQGSFLARYRATGALRWVSSASGTVLALLPDGRGGAYVAGLHSPAGRFGGIQLPTVTGIRLFVAAYDSLGGARWVASGNNGGGSQSQSRADGLGLLPNGTLVVGGSFGRQLVLNSITLTENGSNADPYLARLNPACTVPVLRALVPVLCAGDTLRLLAQGAPAGASFQWNGPNGFTSTQAAPTLPAVTTVATGTYTLITSAPGACVATSTLAVTVNAPPAAPTVRASYNGPTTTLTSSATTGNQWYFNGQPISGATAPTYVVTAPAQLGSYTVVVTNAAGCASSASTPLVVTANSSPFASPSWQLYPNPTPDGRVWLHVPDNGQPLEVTVLNGLGSTVRTLTLPAAGGSLSPINLQSLPTGLYLLRVRSGAQLLTGRLLRE